MPSVHVANLPEIIFPCADYQFFCFPFVSVLWQLQDNTLINLHLGQLHAAYTAYGTVHCFRRQWLHPSSEQVLCGQAGNWLNEDTPKSCYANQS